jgi:hypothetical protein
MERASAEFPAGIVKIYANTSIRLAETFVSVGKSETQLGKLWTGCA